MKKGSPFESKPPALQLRCTACNATVEAACDCGAVYAPAGELAEQAVKANPGESNRAIARRIRVSDKTIAAARKKAGAEYSATEKRMGADGKSYPATKKTGVAKSDTQKVIAEAKKIEKKPAVENTVTIPPSGDRALFMSLLDDLKKAVELARDPAADADDPLIKLMRGLGEKLAAAKLMPLGTFVSRNDKGFHDLRMA